MNLLQTFQTKSKSFYFSLVLLGIVSSITNMGILMQVNIALGGKNFMDFGQYNYLAFAGLLIVSFFTTLFFRNYMADLTNNIMYNMELSVIEKIRNASYSSFEKLGSNRVYAAINDARILSRVPEIFVTIITSAVTLLCALVYLFTVSFLGGITVLVVMVVLAVVYVYRNNQIEKELNAVRDLQDSYYKSLWELIAGFKQIRISALRNRNIFEKFILSNRNRAKALSTGVSKKFVVNELIGVYCWYFVLGVTVFLLPVLFKITILQLAVFLTTILFMMSPVSQLIMFVPALTGFTIAINRINSIDKELVADALPPSSDKPALAKQFDSFRFENVVYRYNQDEKGSFELNLPDFTIKSGEIIFIVGGNGSGKTTFINLLTGLCRADEGKIYIDGKEAPWEEVAFFGNKMAVVYSDQFMFSENYDEHDLSEGNTVKESLTELVNLKGVVKMNKANTAFDTKLSKGQQKRLALLMALLEDKPILILDEWAAEQDPVNRRKFYSEWLPYIRSTGKTIVAVSHDDDFYHMADRVVKFNYGSITVETDDEIKKEPQSVTV